MAERLLFDTDVLIEYLRGRQRAVEYVQGFTADSCVSVVSIAELFVDVRDDGGEASLKQFLLAFGILPVTEGVARLGGLTDATTGRITALAWPMP